jgi:hypothetical protein
MQQATKNTNTRGVSPDSGTFLCTPKIRSASAQKQKLDCVKDREQSVSRGTQKILYEISSLEQDNSVARSCLWKPRNSGVASRAESRPQREVKSRSDQQISARGTKSGRAPGASREPAPNGTEQENRPRQ